MEHDAKCEKEQVLGEVLKGVLDLSVEERDGLEEKNLLCWCEGRLRARRNSHVFILNSTDREIRIRSLISGILTVRKGESQKRWRKEALKVNDETPMFKPVVKGMMGRAEARKDGVIFVDFKKRMRE